MQQVLHYSALKTGVAYIALTLAVIVVLGGRAGARDADRHPPRAAGRARARGGRARCSTPGCRCTATTSGTSSRRSCSAASGSALAFVPMSIGALTGVDRADAGVASGLINTGQQIGGAIGVAAATTIATTYTGALRQRARRRQRSARAALTHGFEIAFYVLAGRGGARRGALGGDDRVARSERRDAAARGARHGGRGGSVTAERRRYQQEVANLLDRIRQGVERLEGLRARGLRGPALADDQAELDRVRGELRRGRAA